MFYGRNGEGINFIAMRKPDNSWYLIGSLKIAKKDSLFARTFSMKRTPTSNRRGVIKTKIIKKNAFNIRFMSGCMDIVSLIHEWFRPLQSSSPL